jgi:DNA (cytosine-5)-methyltransferase 1
MRHGSLFSGIGGFELAAEWMGWENTFHCEFNEFGSKVLSHYWPESKHYGDITKSDFSEFRDTIDILTGGFPCQPYSAAGKRKGKDDDRHLWPHMLRAIREIRPRWVVGENVFGLTTWNGGMVLEEVCAELEAEGYAVQPFIIPACAVGAPHRRDRVWIVANANGLRRREEHDVQQAKLHIEYGEDGIFADADNNGHPPAKVRQCMGEGDDGNATRSQHAVKSARCADESWHVADANLHGRNECNCNDEVNASEGRQYAQRDVEQSDEYGDVANAESKRYQQSCTGNKEFSAQVGPGLHGRSSFEHGGCGTWQNFPTVAPICGGDDGIPRELDGITFPKWRAESIKGYGNAIVPQVALQIFRAIAAMESHS